VLSVSPFQDEDFTIFLCLVFGEFLQHSSTLTKCDKRKIDFNDCLSGAIKNAISSLDKPMEKYNLPSLEPFFVPFFFPKTGLKPEFDTKLKNCKIFGRTKITDLTAKVNFEDKTLTMSITNPEMRYEFDYEAAGVLFLLPIDTSGSGLITIQNVTYTFKFTFEEYTKDNQDYLLVIDSKMVIDPQSMKIYYRNFFKDKVLDDAFSRELTANWKKVVAYFMPIYFDSY
ncbi:unnamed protein product, partial [Tenebrio molitor]